MFFAAEAVFLYHAKVHIKENNAKIVGYFFVVCRNYSTFVERLQQSLRI